MPKRKGTDLVNEPVVPWWRITGRSSSRFRETKCQRCLRRTPLHLAEGVKESVQEAYHYQKPGRRASMSRHTVLQQRNRKTTKEGKSQQEHKRAKRAKHALDTRSTPHYLLTASQLPMRPTSSDGASSTVPPRTFSPATSFGPNLCIVCTISCTSERK